MLHDKKTVKAQIAIVTEDVFSGMGLKHLLEEFIPFAQIDLLRTADEILTSSREHKYFHYFVSADIWTEHFHKLESMSRQVIAYGKAEKQNELPPCTHFIASNKSPQEVTMALMKLQDMAHHQFKRYPNAIARRLKLEDRQQTASLTEREICILKMMASGKSSKEIAGHLHVSISTVYTHRQHIMEKLNAHSATKVITFALNHGFITNKDIK